MNIDFFEEHPFHGGWTKALLTKMTFNMSNGEQTINQSYYPDKSVEFPVIHQDLVGYKTRYTYIAQMTSQVPLT